MRIYELSGEECRLALARSSLGRLGCSHENQPYVVPISIAYECDYIYAFSTFGQKIEWMRTNPRVCVQVDEIENQSQWVSVIATGRYEELWEPHYAVERAHARMVLGNQERWWRNALAERRAKGLDLTIDPVLFRIHVDSMTGLRACANGESLESGVK